MLLYAMLLPRSFLKMYSRIAFMFSMFGMNGISVLYICTVLLEFISRGCRVLSV